MKRNFQSRILAALTAAVIASPLVNADPVVSHEGMADPVTQGWTHTLINCPACALGPGSETTDSGVHDYWQVQDSTTSGISNYFAEPCVIAYAGDWTFEASIRIIDSPVFAGTNIGTTAMFLSDGMNYWSFYIDNDKAGPLGQGTPLTLAVPFALDTRDDYHTYSIAFSQNGPGPEDDTADFFIDGQPIASDLGREDLYASTAQLIFFGAAGTASVMDAHFEYVRFDGNLASDEDGDGVDNDVDNCPLRANASQLDSNADGIGNACDPDLNNDNIVNAIDLGIFKSVFFTSDADADFDGNGVVNAVDLGVLKLQFFESPGPSCLSNP